MSSHTGNFHAYKLAIWIDKIYQLEFIDERKEQTNLQS